MVVRHFKEFSKVKQQKTKVSHSASLHCSIHNSHNCLVTLQSQMTVAIKTIVSKIASFYLVLKCKLGQGDIKGWCYWQGRQGVWSKCGRLLAEFPRETLLVSHHPLYYVSFPLRVSFILQSPTLQDSPIQYLSSRHSTRPNLTLIAY